MAQIVEMDPRALSTEKKWKVAGAAVVAAAASGVVIVGGLSIIAASVVGLTALAVLNFAVPVGARYIALKKQQALTALAETFSEETIREDELAEGRRLQQQETTFMTLSAELGGGQEQLKSAMETANEEERNMLQGRIDQLQGVIDGAEKALKEKKADFAELQRINKLYIAFHRSAEAMEKYQGQKRNPAEQQRLETARESIKKRMREQMAGAKIEAMDQAVHQKLSMSRVAQLGVSQPSIISQPIDMKEVERVPNRR